MDLTVGFLLYFDITRWLGTAMSCNFHIMNSRMFKIGMLTIRMNCSNKLLNAIIEVYMSYLCSVYMCVLIVIAVLSLRRLMKLYYCNGMYLKLSVR